MPKSAIRSQIVHLLYATALISSTLATFGANGVVFGIILGATWGWVFVSGSRPRALQSAALFILLSGCLCGLVFSALSSPREAATRMQCANNLKQIAIALHNYHDVFKSFPPAYISDDDGRPMHSWRVLILPFVEQQALYEKYDFNEPWDGPNNRLLLSQIPWVYRCPTCETRYHGNSTFTSYQAVVGKETVWPKDRACRISEIIDGPARTALVLEVSDVNTPWMSPQDISYDKAIDLLSSRTADFDTGHITQSFFYEWANGRNSAFVDGSVHFLHGSIDRDAATQFLEIEDGQSLDTARLDGIGQIATQRLRIDNCIRLGIFVLIALWPLPWVWINPHGITSNATETTEAPESSP